MKNSPATTALIATAFFAAGHLPAQEAANPAKTTAYQTSVSQEQLRGMTKRLKGEMIGLLDEFGHYQAASDELVKLKDALGQLDTVTEQDMAAVVKILREASRLEKPDETKAKLVEASSEQKEIQKMLRSVADRLTLQKDAASIQQRLDKLAARQLANQRETQKLADSGSKPDKVKWDQKKTQDVTKAEQQALREEVRMTMDTLRNLAEKTEAPTKDAFKEALKSGLESQIEQQARESAEKLNTDFVEAAKSQAELAKNLQKMVDGLQAKKSTEEQTRELAEQMKQLAEKQEQLAKASPRAWEQNRAQIKKDQEAISDRLEQAKESLQKLNPEAAAKAEQAKQESNDVAKALQDKEAFEKADNIAKNSDSQKSVAEKLEATSKMLQKQADALAAAENPQGQQESQTAEQSPAEQAISDAVNQVVDAKSEMSMAKRQLEQNGNVDNAKQRLDKAEASLNSAREQLAKAGDAVPQNISEELKAAAENAQKAEDGAGVGSKQDQEKSRWNLDKAQQNADRALAGLQQAANQLASQQADKASQQQAQAKSQQKGKGQGQESKDDQAGPAGGKMSDKGRGTEVSAVAKSQGGQREALTLLQQEKAPTEYEAMVQQYIRNLAESANQGQ